MDNVLVKSGLNQKQLILVQSEVERNKKSPAVMYLLWFFTGGIGGHRYYLGDFGVGIAMTLTLGGLGLWALIDVFFIGNRLRTNTERLEFDIINRVKAMT